MQISERVEDVTGETPAWWALELYKVAFLLVGGMYVGWTWSNHATSSYRGAVIGGGAYTPDPPVWMLLMLIPGIVYLLWIIIPWPGRAGGLSM